MTQKIYDTIIVGGGPAGLGAAIYSARDRFETAVLEKFYPGGQILNTDRIENYPGFEDISGGDLIANMYGQAQKFGAEFKTGTDVQSIKKLADGNIEVNCDTGQYLSKAVILAPGSSYRKLDVPGEDEFRSAGTGVSYCGTCDGPFYKGKKVVAVGGGNTAIEEALHVAKFAAELTLVHRRQEFRATKVLVEELMEKVDSPQGNIKLQLDSVVTAIEGDEKVQSVKIQNVKTQAVEDVDCDGVFIFVGMVPNTDFLQGSIELTDAGFIKCDVGYLRTKTPGVFAAGDCRTGAAMQLVTAIADGVNAAMMTKQYFRDVNWWNEPVSDSLTPGGW
ncbi:MAG: FAD-dependent oxidoreductase [Anaerohalosphaeraceae bacterium]|nr:FAD-dependent oxidoreductase [Anaerohalosphaeraceae bacterium]